MSTAPRRDPRPVATLDDAVAVLREDGGRVSTARRAILTVLLEASGPLSTEQVAAGATPPLDVPATYRNLDHLEARGLVRHVHLGHGPGLYELESEVEHEYALCEACGTTLAVAPETLDAARATLEEAVGLRPRFTHFPLVGRCRDCRTAVPTP